MEADPHRILWKRFGGSMCCRTYPTQAAKSLRLAPYLWKSYMMMMLLSSPFDFDHKRNGHH
eukprot:gene1517-902_t